MYINIKSGAKITDEAYNKLNARLKAKYQKFAQPTAAKTKTDEKKK